MRWIELTRLVPLLLAGCSGPPGRHTALSAMPGVTVTVHLPGKGRDLELPSGTPVLAFERGSHGLLVEVIIEGGEYKGTVGVVDMTSIVPAGK